MSPLNSANPGFRNPRLENLERVQASVEVAYADPRKVGSFSVPAGTLLRLSPGDQIYVSSGGNGAYRMVVRVEAIADGSVMVWLDSGRRPGTDVQAPEAAQADDLK